MKLSNAQQKVIEAMKADPERIIYQSPYYNYQEVSDRKFEGFRMYFTEATLHALIKKGAISYIRDFKWVLTPHTK